MSNVTVEQQSVKGPRQIPLSNVKRQRGIIKCQGQTSATNVKMEA